MHWTNEVTDPVCPVSWRGAGEDQAGPLAKEINLRWFLSGVYKCPLAGGVCAQGCRCSGMHQHTLVIRSVHPHVLSPKEQAERRKHMES